MRTRGQSWSMDLVIGVVIFGFIAVVFYSLLTVQQKPSVDELQTRAQQAQLRLEKNVAACGGPIIENQTVNPARLKCLYDLNSTTFHQTVGTSNNICIYIEDQNSRVLIITNETGSIQRAAVGDPALSISGSPCGAIVP